MRCEEAKRRMGAKAPDRELMEHIAGCPSCARHAEAAQVLERLLKDAGQETPIMSFAAVRDRVNMIAKQQSTGEKIMSHLKDQYQTRPRLIAAMGLIMAAFVFAVLVPFSSTQTIGWKVSLDGIDASAAPSKTLLNAAFATAGLEDIYVSTMPGDDSADDIVVKAPSKEEAREIVRALIAAKVDSLIQLSIEPVVVTKSQPILAQVYQRAKGDYEKARDSERASVRIMFDGTGLRVNGKGLRDILSSSKMTDAEIKAEIEKILGDSKDQGDEPVTVDVETSANAKVRTIVIRADKAELTHSLSEIKLISAGKRIALVRGDDDISVPDSGMVIQLTVPDDDDDSLKTRRIILKIALDIDDDD